MVNSEIQKFITKNSNDLENDLNSVWNLIRKSDCREEEIENLYFAKVICIPNLIQDIHFDDFNKIQLFRARNINCEDEDISLVSTFSYPPQNCTLQNRANMAKKPVFYCTDHPGTAIYEIKPESQDSIYLSVWKPKVDRILKISILISDKIPLNNPWYFLKDIIEDYFVNPNTPENSKVLIRLMSKIFKEEIEPYNLTSWISKFILYNNDQIDGLLYESVAGNSKQCNLVFHPNIVDRYFQIDRVYKMGEITRETTSDRLINPIEIPCQIGNLHNKKIIWRNFKKSDLAEYPFTKEKFSKMK